MGIFTGGITYIFYPGSRLIEQRAIVSTSESDTAFFYNAGIRISNDADVRSGGNMKTEVSYFDTEGKFQTVRSDGPEWHPVSVRYRALAARLGNGSIVISCREISPPTWGMSGTLPGAAACFSASGNFRTTTPTITPG